MQAFDQVLRARKWPTERSLAAEVKVDPRTIHP
jgi:hypothetical protein